VSATVVRDDARPVRDPERAAPASGARRGWAVAGVGAALAGVVGFLASGAFGGDLYDDEMMGDNAVAAATLADERGALAVFLAAATVTSLLLVVFAAGLRRRLEAQAPPGGLLPSVAAGGLALCAALSLVGAGIGTELFWGLGAGDDVDPDSIMSMYHLVATMSWVWAGAAVTAGAVAVAALRHGALPRWIGWVSAVAGVVVLGFSLIPLQYMSGMVGCVWLLVVSVGLLVSREQAV
jgi:hypothetical protein